MHRRHGRSRFRQPGHAWELTALILLALVGISLVNEPEKDAAEETAPGPYVSPASYEAEKGPATVRPAGKRNEEPETGLKTGGEP